MASLYQRPSSSVLWLAWASSNAASMAQISSKTPEQQRGIARRIDVQAHPPPLDAAALPSHKVFDRGHAPGLIRWSDLEVAAMKPELARGFVERDRHSDRIAALYGLLDETDHLTVIDRYEAQVAGLLQSRIAAPNAVETGDVVLDVARL